jgi:hypothetical protein
LTFWSLKTTRPSVICLRKSGPIFKLVFLADFPMMKEEICDEDEAIFGGANSCGVEAGGVGR